MKRAVQALIKEKYCDVNLTHLGELLADNENLLIKGETLRNWAHEIHHVKRATLRRSQVIFANSPRGKSRVERLFDTFQDRPILELRLNKIVNMASANTYLQGTVIPSCWQKIDLLRCDDKVAW